MLMSVYCVTPLPPACTVTLRNISINEHLGCLLLSVHLQRRILTTRCRQRSQVAEGFLMSHDPSVPNLKGLCEVTIHLHYLRVIGNIVGIGYTLRKQINTNGGIIFTY